MAMSTIILFSFAIFAKYVDGRVNITTTTVSQLAVSGTTELTINSELQVKLM